MVGVSAEETEADSAEPAIEHVGDVVVGLIGQQEQRPGKAVNGIVLFVMDGSWKEKAFVFWGKLFIK